MRHVRQLILHVLFRGHRLMRGVYLIFLLCNGHLVCAQNTDVFPWKCAIFSCERETPVEFILSMREADSLITVGKYNNAIEIYDQGGKLFPFETNVYITYTYNKAKALALSGRRADCLDVLKDIVYNDRFYDYETLQNEVAFSSLYKHKEWPKLLVYCKQQFESRRSDYIKMIHAADSFFIMGNYGQAGLNYSFAFVRDPLTTLTRGVDQRIKAVQSWAMAENKDSAFMILFPLVEKGFYYDPIEISKDTSLNSLHVDPRWSKVIDKAGAKYKMLNAKINPVLLATLDSMYQNDQKTRERFDGIEKKYGFQSKEMQELLNEMKSLDSANLLKLERIFKEYGWPSPQVAGDESALTIFLVLQHAPLEVQEKYWPLMVDANKKQYIDAPTMALFEDRILVGKGLKQKFGTQVSRDEKTGKYYIPAIEDEKNVNARREAIGLEPIEVYVKRFGIDYVAPK